MKEVIRKNILDLPYSLHDARVSKITMEEEKIILYFSQGFYELRNDDYLAVKGKSLISIEGWDLDFCAVYLFDSVGNNGKLSGEKYRLDAFINRFPHMDFEIIDETYGYNQSKFSGYFYEGNKIKECTIDIYHFGNMKYVVQNS
ncbi:hypothetical protein [Anaerotignum propionicum]|uniref:hypothetical protein n=1 Tax=Anaerotignum propionicum TaxID=28446 RepID=UPI002109811A|nr:hypothetical protein [Anaerotignum propionicum]MCQ4937140.1 hypothetical protein [Anaerotignum propionicum]